jgi:hypothetical protein
MERDLALQTIEGIIGPFIGRHMAKAATELHARRLGLPGGPLTVEQLRSVLDAIGKGMLVLVGRDKTSELLRLVEAGLGIDAAKVREGSRP